MQQLPYAIIGAGPSGLAAARALQKAGLSFIGFEKHSQVGGLWDISNPHSTVYQSAHLISSKRMTEFAEFPMKDSVADYPSHRELLNYFKDFAQHFGLNQHFHFNSSVERIERLAEGNWKITANAQEYKVAGILLATGTLHYPNLPELKGEFTGESLHSSQYKDPTIFKNKRVLIVGCGNSACDIAVDAIHHAQSVHISVRRGYHFVPKYIFGKPADTLGKSKLPAFIQRPLQKTILQAYMGSPERFGFPKADHALFESHPIVNSLILHHAGHGDIQVKADIEKAQDQKIFFKDQSSEEYDLILWATGYKLKYPFMDHQLLNWQQSAPKLYLNIFHPQMDNLFIVGMLEALGIGWQGRYQQAELIALYLKHRELNSAAFKNFNSQKLKPLDLSGRMNYLKLPRMSYYVHKATYLNEIRKHKRLLGAC